jgi:hypothetical protein
MSEAAPFISSENPVPSYPPEPAISPAPDAVIGKKSIIGALIPGIALGIPMPWTMKFNSPENTP